MITRDMIVDEGTLLEGTKLAMCVADLDKGGKDYWSDPGTRTYVLVKHANEHGITFFVKTELDPLEQYGLSRYAVKWLPDDQFEKEEPLEE